MKRYRIYTDPEEGVKLSANSLVDNPATDKGKYAFSKDHPKRVSVSLNTESSQGKQTEVKYEFDDEKQNIVGVAIVPDLPIFRNNESLGKHEVVFSKDDIEVMAYQDGWKDNLNFNHDPNEPAKTATNYLSYIIDSDNGMTTPDKFEGEPEGSLLLGYHFDDKTEYEYARDNFQGFSIEGDFYLEEIQENMSKVKMSKGKFTTIAEVDKWEIEVDQETIEEGTLLTQTWKDANGEEVVSKLWDGEYMLEDGRRILVDTDSTVRVIFNSINMNPNEKKFFKSLEDKFSEFFKSFKPKTEKFGSATLDDGTVLEWEGDLAEGVAIFVKETGEPAPDGEHTFENGTVINVSGGVVESIVEAEEEEEMDKDKDKEEFNANAMDAIGKLMEATEAMSKQIVEQNELMEAQKKHIEEQDSKIEEFEKVLAEFAKDSPKPGKSKFDRKDDDTLKPHTKALMSRVFRKETTA